MRLTCWIMYDEDLWRYLPSLVAVVRLELFRNRFDFYNMGGREAGGKGHECACCVWCSHVSRQTLNFTRVAEESA